jgi:hypothetical protein
MTSWKPELCIYHGNCDDGFGAAWAIWTMWPDCDFVPGFYGMDLPNVDGKNVLFVDFSAKRPVIDAIAQTAKTIVIIDHHKTAEADLEPFAVTMCGSACLHPNDIQHMFRDLAELDRPPIIAWFDMEQSGAAMAWQFAQGGHRDEYPIPTMLEWIEDRDLWRFVHGDTTREFSAALRTYPMDFKVWEQIAENPRDLIKEGRIVLRAHRANIEKLIRETYIETIGGFSVPVVNAPYHYASDTAHELLAEHPEAPFAACWFRRADGQIQWSLRSEDHRQDVSEIAKSFGGGGHRNAAGFQSLPPSLQPNVAGTQVDYPKILYVCEICFEGNNESCGNDRDRINVTPDGRWLCEDCRDGEGIDVSLCRDAPKLYTAPAPASSEPSKEQIEKAIEAYREGVYLTDEQVHASVTAIVRTALATTEGSDNGR